MKSIFEKSTIDELINRINSLSAENKAQWGKMNIYQMLMHNVYWNGWILGDRDHHYKHAFIGKIFGRMVLKKMIKDEKHFDKNVPTSAQFKVKEINGNLEEEKTKWISYIKAFSKFYNPGFIHDFFGKMNKEEIGILVYKHSDHHLRQFGA